MSNLKNILGPMRLPFLLLTPACILVGGAAAQWTHGEINMLFFILALIGGIAAHISVNSFNEYYDFKSGLDFKTQRTPFSGGSGTLPNSPESAKAALITALTTFIITGATGVFFLFKVGFGLLPLGVLGLINIIAYTIWFTRSPILSLISPGLGFGTFMVMGTYFVLTGEYSWTAFFASLVPFFLVSNLLLLNQFPDAEADKSIGRSHYPIRIGNKASSYIYGVFMFLAYFSVLLGFYLNFLPVISLISLFTILIAVPATIGAINNYNNIPKLIPFMGMNVIINIITPILLSIGLFLSY